MSNKSILFISLLKGASWGGSEQLWYKTALYAAQNGYQVSCAIFDLKGKEDKLDVLRQAGCTIVLLPFSEKKRQFFKKLYYKLFSKHVTNYKLNKVVNDLKKHYYDYIVINQSGFMDIVNDPWNDIDFKCKVSSLVYHNYIEKYVFSTSKADKMRKRLNAVSHNLFAANHMHHVLSKQLNFSIPNSELIYNPIAFESKYSDLAVSENESLKMIMLAALISSTKSQDCLITVLSSEKWKKRDWILEFYGNGPDKEQLEKMIAKAELGNKVFLRGFTKDVQEVINNAHVLLQITRQDAMPIAVIEAMAVGRPIIASRIGDMPKWVLENENGWIAEDTSYDEIDRVLELLWLNKMNLQKMGKRSFELFESKFPQNVEQRFLDQITN